MFCPKCGRKIVKKVNFCSKCGADLAKFKLKPSHVSANRQILNNDKIALGTSGAGVGILNKKRWMATAAGVILNILGLYALMLGFHLASSEGFISGFREVRLLEGISRGFLLPLSALPDIEDIAESVIGPYCILIGAFIITVGIELTRAQKWAAVAGIVLCSIGVIGGAHSIVGAALPALALFFILKS